MENFKSFFDTNGFVLVKDFFNKEEAEKIIRFADEIEKWDEEKGKWMIYFEKNETEKKRCRIENFIAYHSELKDFLYSKVFPLVDTICDEKMNLFKEKLNWKNGGGKGFKAHQDHPAWNDFEPDKYVTLALFANNCTKENGCLQFGLENSKITDFCPYKKKAPGLLDEEYENSLEWQLLESSPFDILLFDSFVPHRSFENKTDNPRRIFYFTFHSSKFGNLYDLYLKKKRIEFPPEIERNDIVRIDGNKYNLANPIE